MTKLTCIATKADGSPCRTKFGLSAAGYCLQHDPERADEARAMRSKGGKAPRGPRPPASPVPLVVPPAPKTFDDAVAYASWLTHAIASGALDPKQGREATQALNSFRTALDKRDIAKRYDALAAFVKRMKKCKDCAALAPDEVEAA
jgi:hypothetical protein